MQSFFEGSGSGSDCACGALEFVGFASVRSIIPAAEPQQRGSNKSSKAAEAERQTTEHLVFAALNGLQHRAAVIDQGICNYAKSRCIR